MRNTALEKDALPEPEVYLSETCASGEGAEDRTKPGPTDKEVGTGCGPGSYLLPLCRSPPSLGVPRGVKVGVWKF